MDQNEPALEYFSINVYKKFFHAMTYSNFDDQSD